MLSFLLFVDMTFSLLTEMGGFFPPVSADPFCFLVCWELFKRMNDGMMTLPCSINKRWILVIGTRQGEIA